MDPDQTAPVRLQVRKRAQIRNIYNQVPQLTQDTTLEIDKNTRKHNTQESQEANPYPPGDHTHV